MLYRIILYLGAAITTLIFVLVVLDLTLLGTRNIIRNSIANIRVFILLIGIPYIVLFLILLIFQVLPNYLFPIELVLLIAYGLDKKHIIVKIQSIVGIQPLKQSEIAIALTRNQPRPCLRLSKDLVRFINLLVILAFAMSGAIWVSVNEENPWIIYPAAGAIGFILLLARLFEIAEVVRFVTRKLSKQDDE